MQQNHASHQHHSSTSFLDHRAASYSAAPPHDPYDTPDDFYRQHKHYPGPLSTPNDIVVEPSPDCGAMTGPVKNQRKSVSHANGTAVKPQPVPTSARPSAFGSSSSSSTVRSKTSIKDLVNQFNQSPVTSPRSSNANSISGIPSPRYARSRIASEPRLTAAAAARSSISNKSDTSVVGSASPAKLQTHKRNASDKKIGPVGTSRPRERNGSKASTSSPPPKYASKSFSSLRAQTAPARPPLFGEVVYDRRGTDGTDNLGYGIRADEMRRGSEGSMHIPNPMFPHRRSQSDMLVSPLSPTSPSFDQQDSSPTKPHRRSRSDIAHGSLPRPTKLAQAPRLDIPLVSPIQSPDSPAKQAWRSPVSRIPVRARRPSSTSESACSTSTSRTGSGMDAEKNGNSSMPALTVLQPRVYSGKENVPQNRPTTPSTQTANRRYQASPNKTPTSNQSLKAYISAPPPKKSPPLRSSRPRQPISSASTSASRAKISDRFSSSPKEPSPRETLAFKDYRTRPKRIPDLGAVDFAARREKIQQAFAQSVNENRKIEARASNEQLAQRSSRVPSRVGDKSNREKSGQRHTSQFSNADEARETSGVKLFINVDQLAAPDPTEPLTATTDIDESPVLGRSDPPSADAADAVSMPEPELQSPTEPDRLDKSEEAHPDAEVDDGGAYLHPLDEAGTLLKQVMQMRSHSLSSDARTEFEEGASERDDSESIKIMLGATPTLANDETPWELDGGFDREDTEPSPDLPESPLSECVAENSRPTSHVSFLDARASVVPDDSISIINERRHMDCTSADATPVIGTERGNGRFTLAGEAYSTVNRVLEDYYKSHQVTPEMAHSFQMQIQSVSPELARFDGWSQKTAAQEYLQQIIGDPRLRIDSSHDGMLNLSNHIDNSESMHTDTRIDGPSVDEGYGGGTAIIFTSARRYSRDTVGGAPGTQHEEERPVPPPKDLRFSPVPRPNSTMRSRSEAHLPIANIEISNGGLNIHVSKRGDSPRLHSPPPLPDHSPPPPPAVLLRSTTSPERLRSPPSPSIYRSEPPSSVFPAFTPDGPSNLRTPPSIPESGPSEQTLHITIEPRLSRPPAPSLHSTRASSTDGASRKESPRGSDQRRLKQRWNLIRELVDTEFAYNSDMCVVENIYKGTSTSCMGIDEDDKRILFGNTEQIVAFSDSFYDALKHAAASVYVPSRNSRWNVARTSQSTANSAQTEPASTEGPEWIDDAEDRKTFIGEAFAKNMARLEKVYGAYLKNHDAANQRLQKLQAMPDVEIWLRECLEQIQDITKAWSLDSLLVKPVQRVLKYPLILKQLLETTPENHPDYTALSVALQEILDASHRINESKRRADVVDQVVNRKPKQPEPKLGLSVSKLVNWRTEKFRQQVGLSESYEDYDYKAITEKWGRHFIGLQIVMRDFRDYTEDVQRIVDQCNNYVVSMEEFLDVGQSNYPEIESKWRKFSMAIREITAIALTEHKTQVHSTIIVPFLSLIRIHDGPSKAMSKRKKRIVDYARYRTIKDKGDKMDKKTQEQGEQFIALNDSIKDDLPKLYALSAKFVHACLERFIFIQMQWYKTWERKIRAVIEEQQIPKDLSELVESFMSDYSYSEAQVLSLGICNGSLLADISNFLSFSGTTLVNPANEDSQSQKRPSTLSSRRPTLSLNSEHSPSLPTPDFGNSKRNSGAFIFSPLAENGPLLDTQSHPSPAGRARAGSAFSSRGPSTPNTSSAPRSLSTVRPDPLLPNRPSTATGRAAEPSSPTVPRRSVDGAARPVSGTTFYSSVTDLNNSMPPPPPPQPQSSLQRGTTPPIRFSGIFSSAMPMSDSSPEETRVPSPEAPVAGLKDPEVLFLAASLFEFNIDRSRREAGYPYLPYVPGEVFDVIAQKGELWLARNQDDAGGQIGWIWEKHFVTLPSEGD